MRDTIALTPQIRKLRNIYIKALLDKGDTNEALKQYRLASKNLPSPAHDEQADLMIGGKLSNEGRYKEALLLYQDGLQRTHCKSEPLLIASIRLLQVMQAEDTLPIQERERFADLKNLYSSLLDVIKRRRLNAKARNLETLNQH